MISSLANYTNISPNRTSPRNNGYHRISIHCFVGQVSAKRGVDCFSSTSARASANYVVGKDGDVGCAVDEVDRSWCTSSGANDHQAITIEVASGTTSPYIVTDSAYQALLDLCVDICKRHGKKKLLWFGDKDKSLDYQPAEDEMVLTVHRWFANKACPGAYLYNKHSEIAEYVTAQLNGGTMENKNEPSSWAKESWEKAKAAGVLDGTNPQGACTREMLAVILDRLELI